MSLFALYSYREPIAGVGATLVLAIALTFSVQQTLPHKPDPSEPVVISIVPAPLEPIAPPPPPTQIRPVAQERSRPVSQTAQPVQAPVTVPVTSASSALEVPAETRPASEHPSTAPGPSAEIAPAVAPPKGPSPASVEAEYVARIRAYLETLKRYPTSRDASIQRPEGTARVWFELERDGSIKDVGIEESSNSLILDTAAVATVRRGHPPAFPDSAWAGSATHRFTVDLAFKPAN